MPFMFILFSAIFLSSAQNATKKIRRCRYRNSIRFPYHWLRQKSIPQATAVLICHSGIRFVWSHGSVLFDDGLLVALRLLRSVNTKTTTNLPPSPTTVKQPPTSFTSQRTVNLCSRMENYPVHIHLIGQRQQYW